jgi:hypothetical protein
MEIVHLHLNICIAIFTLVSDKIDIYSKSEENKIFSLVVFYSVLLHYYLVYNLPYRVKNVKIYPMLKFAHSFENINLKILCCNATFEKKYLHQKYVKLLQAAFCIIFGDIEPFRN